MVNNVSSSKSTKLPITAICVCGPGEKPYIERAFNSVDFADQKILVSDYAEESVLELAREKGWEIFSWDGPNSMCQRRNYSVGWKGEDGHTPFWTQHSQMSSHYPKINNEWFIQIDDDEVYEDRFVDYCRELINHPNEGIVAVSIDLRNVFADSDESMSSTPLPRLFRRGVVHWEKDIQNDVVYEGDTGWMPCIMRHYGYGSLYDHWEKQWKRMRLNEVELLKNPNDLDARGYLVNCLAVVGGDPINQARLLGHVAESITQFLKSHNKDRASQICIQRTVRHIWATCANSGNYAVFVALLSRVEEHIDWIVDVPYWKVVCAFHTNEYDFKVIDRFGKDYLRASDNHRKPPVLNIEVQAIDEEINVANNIYQLLLRTLVLLRQNSMRMNPDEYNKLRKEAAKRARWWKKQCNKQVYMRFLRENGIDPYREDVMKHQGVIFESNFEQERAVMEMRSGKTA